MHVAAQRTLVISTTDGEPGFTLVNSDGTVHSHGRFPEEAAPAEFVAVADYDLLRLPGLFDFSTSGAIGLLPPRRSTGAAFAHGIWREGDTAAIISPDELRSLAPFLKMRHELTAMLDQTNARIHRLVGDASPEYLRVLGRGAQLTPEAIALLREYPTLDRLGSSGLLQVTRFLESTFGTSNRQTAEQLLALRLARAEIHPAGDFLDGFAEAAIGDAIELHALLSRQRSQCDGRIYRLASKERVISDRRPLSSPFSILDYSQHAVGGSAAESHTPFEHYRDSVARRGTVEQHPQRAFEEYRRARAELAAATLSPDELLALEVAGQLLALSSGDYFDAIRSRAACDALFASDQLPAPDGDPAILRLRADALVVMALTEAVAVDVLPGFSALRNVIENDRTAAAASPELLSEAYGLFVLVLAFFGERSSYPRAIAEVRRLVEAHGGSGASRAAADIAEFFVAAGLPGTPAAELETLRATAELHSRDTPYRFYYNYVMMVSAYVTKGVEQALVCYSDIKREGLSSRFNRRFDRLARAAYGILLSAQGNFAGAEREFASFASSHDASSDGADDMIVQLYGLRLELARGRHQNTLIQTLPDGPLGETRFQSVHLRRYIPASLMLRGTALAREGSAELANEVFMRAAQQAAIGGEGLTLLCGETPEFRAWFEGLDRDGLPHGLAPETYDAVLGSPLFLDYTIPSLTPQQDRILQLLAQGRSTASIAAELHISGNTLKTHLRKLYQRLGVRSREQAVLHAESYGFFA